MATYKLHKFYRSSKSKRRIAVPTPTRVASRFDRRPDGVRISHTCNGFHASCNQPSTAAGHARVKKFEIFICVPRAIRPHQFTSHALLNTSRYLASRRDNFTGQESCADGWTVAVFGRKRSRFQYFVMLN